MHLHPLYHAFSSNHHDHSHHHRKRNHKDKSQPLLIIYRILKVFLRDIQQLKEQSPQKHNLIDKQVFSFIKLQDQRFLCPLRIQEIIQKIEASLRYQRHQIYQTTTVSAI